MKKIISLVICYCVSANLFALVIIDTTNIAERLIYQGNTVLLTNSTIDFYSETSEVVKIVKLSKEQECSSKLERKKYIITWEISNNKLYLNNVHNVCVTHNDRYLVDEFIKPEFSILKELFPNKYKNGTVFADWVTTEITVNQGKMLYYVEFASSFEKELEFKIRSGIIVSTIIYDNSKSKTSEYSANHASKSLEWIYSHIQWEKFKLDNNQIKVIIRFSANENGKIDSITVLRNYEDKAFELEAIRVIKSIPEWDVYFKKGKHIRLYFTIPVMFNKSNKKKYQQYKN